MFERSRMRDASRDDRGASALEFAIVVPVLLILLFGMLEYGFVFQAQLAVTHAAREGARMAAVDDWDPGLVEDRAFPLKAADGLSVSLSNPDAESVQVTVTYPWSWLIFPFGDPPTLSSSATMRKE